MEFEKRHLNKTMKQSAIIKFSPKKKSKY